jgi:hypothetical protein
MKNDEQIIEQLEQRLLRRVKLQYASIILEHIDSQRIQEKQQKEANSRS